jgi:DNA mismatch repair protein MutL
MPIKVLAPQVVSKIAAGEVIERPSSVVKELIENCLDSGATQIILEIKGGGVGFIRVSDNGSGIADDEVETAFLRHATSKIDALNDLERLSTLGFRGEALPSIAAVADVEILSNTSESDSGSYLRLEGGDIKLRERRSRARGTTVTVHNLFRHLPARLKFLKAPSTEGGHIANLVAQYAMAYPEVRFSFTVDGRQNLATSGNGKLSDVIAEVYGLDTAEQMIEVNYAEPGCEVSGMVSIPSLSRSNRNYLSFFVNRRWIKSSLLIHSVEYAYQGSLMTGKHPVAVLNINLPPQDLDVNVHPSKTEVKFRNNNIVYSAVDKAIKKSLASSPVKESRSPLSFSAMPTTPGLWQERPITAPAETQNQVESFGAGSKNQTAATLPILRVIGQLASMYIIAEGQEGLYLVDQHAAHERILFERVLKQQGEKNNDMQGLLEPVQIELNPRQREVLSSQTGLLSQFGLALESFGGRSYLLRAVPAILAGSDIPEAVREILDSLAGEFAESRRLEKLAQSMACHGAIKAGQTLSFEEMKELLRQLEQCEKPRTCPHGRPTMIHLSSYQLEKEFGRVR